MKSLLLGLVVLTNFAQSKLVIYGPQELIDKFNKVGTSSDQKSKWRLR